MTTVLAIALVVAVWAVLPFPLAVLVGRALRNGAALPTADASALGIALGIAPGVAAQARVEAGVAGT